MQIPAGEIDSYIVGLPLASGGEHISQPSGRGQGGGNFDVNAAIFPCTNWYRRRVFLAVAAMGTKCELGAIKRGQTSLTIGSFTEIDGAASWTMGLAGL